MLKKDWAADALIYALIIFYMFALWVAMSGPPPDEYAPRQSVILSSEAKKKQPPREEQGRIGNENQRTAQDSQRHAPVNIECDPNCAKKGPDKEANQSYPAWFIGKLLDDPISLLTFIIAITALFTLIVVAIQAGDGKKAAKAAAEAASASTRQAEIAEKTAERQLRAYVFDSAGGITTRCSGLVPTGTCNILVEIKNYGSTPANKFNIIVSAAIFTDEPSDFPHQEDKREGSFNILAPQYARDVHKSIDCTYDDVIEVINRRKRIFVWGKISYVDAFGKARWFKFYRKNGQSHPWRNNQLESHGNR